MTNSREDPEAQAAALLPSQVAPSYIKVEHLKVLILAVAYMCTSAGLISFNKFLMMSDHFPYAVVLVLLHMVSSSIFSFSLLFFKPSLFTSMNDPEIRATMDRNLFLRGALPIAVLFSLSLVLSNTAYMFSSVAFLQMLKEVNVVLVYLFSLAAALEKFSSRNCLILVCIVCATSFTVHGELHFSIAGFIIQFLACIMECAKVVAQAILLSPSGRKLDALTYVLIVNPVSLAVLGVILLTFSPILPGTAFAVPMWSELLAWWPYLLANCMVAFALNLLLAFFIQKSSPVACMLAGIAKDISIVTAGSMVLGEMVSYQQAFGFSIQLMLILLWSSMKVYAKQFENGLLCGIYSLVPWWAPGEGMGLITTKK